MAETETTLLESQSAYTVQPLTSYVCLPVSTGILHSKVVQLLCSLSPFSCFSGTRAHVAQAAQKAAGLGPNSCYRQLPSKLVQDLTTLFVTHRPP